MAPRRARLWALSSLGLAAATGCSLIVGTETRTLGVDASDNDVTQPPPDAGADTFVDDASDAAVIPQDAACGASCFSQAQACGQNCVAVYDSCVANCTNTPCKSGCATSESACFSNCESTCTGCTNGAGCTNQAACQDASVP